MPILESGEMLGFIQVQVQSGDVAITEKWHLFIAASPKVRKKMLRDIIIQFNAFRKIVDLIKESENGHVKKDELLEFISANGATPTTNSDELDHFDWHLFLIIMLIQKISL